MEAREQHITINGFATWIATQGRGRPAVLCHGGPGHFDNLAPVADMIDDLLTIHRYDQRGCGRSDDARPYTLGALVGDLESLRKHFGYERWIVGGHSFGASLALGYATRYPERVEALILLSSAGLLGSYGQDYRLAYESRLLTEQLQHLQYLHTRYIAATSADERQMLANAMRRIKHPTDFADFSCAPNLDDEPFAPNFQLNADVNADWKRFADEGDLEEAVRDLEIPTLVIHGAADPRPEHPAKQLAALLPQGRFRSLPNVGHYPWLEHPDHLRTALRQFLTGLLQLPEHR